MAFHLAHFTVGSFGAELALDAQGRPDVYSMVVGGFREPWIAGTYLFALCVLGLHLFHGARSALRTFGISHESYDLLIRGAAYSLVAAIILGNASIPLLILSGVL